MIRILFLWWTFSHYKVPPYLAFRFCRRPFSASNFVLHLQIVNIRVSLWRGKVWLRLLSEVKLNSAVLYQDMREQSSACQCLLGCPESHTQRHTIFWKAHLYLFTAFKVLKWWWPSKNVFSVSLWQQHWQHIQKILILLFLKASTTYNVTADDIIFTKLLTEVAELAAFGLLPCSSISKGEGLLT